MRKKLPFRNVNNYSGLFLYSGYLTRYYGYNYLYRINFHLFCLFLLLFMYSTELYFLVYKFVGFGMMQKFNYFLDKAFFPYQYEFKIYYSYLKIVGLGFRLKRCSRNVLCFFLVRPNRIYTFAPHNVLVVFPRLGSYAKVKRLLFVGLNRFVVNCLMLDILLLKRLSPYRVFGIMNRKQLVILRSGKQR